MALEGADRLGKSTQAKALAEALENSRFRFNSCVVKIPYKDDYTYDRIYEMLFSGEAEMYPQVFQSWQALNRHIFQKDVLPVLAKRKDLIILDRWNMSTFVYGTSSGVPVAATKMMLQGIFEPDVNFVFTGKPFVMDTEKDAYEKNDNFQNHVRVFYEHQIRNDNNSVRVNANETPEAVTHFLLDFIEKFMLQHEDRWLNRMAPMSPLIP